MSLKSEKDHGILNYKDRTQQFSELRPVSKTRDCEVADCGAKTSELKPYCMKHIDLMPEGGEVALELKRRAWEVSKAARGHYSHIELDSSVTMDVINALQVDGKEWVSFERAANVAKIPVPALVSYLKALKRLKLARTRYVGRKRQVASYTG